MQVAQQLSGINAVFYYSTTFLAGVVDSPVVGTALVGAVNVLATAVASGLMDDDRRVSMLALSLGGMLFSALVLTAALAGYLANPAWALGGVVAYVRAGVCFLLRVGRPSPLDGTKESPRKHEHTRTSQTRRRSSSSSSGWAPSRG